LYRQPSADTDLVENYDGCVEETNVVLGNMNCDYYRNPIEPYIVEKVTFHVVYIPEQTVDI
jgi:hypothetical protein